MEINELERWQKARRDATNIIVACLNTGHVPFGNVSKGKRLDLIRGQITLLTEQLLEEEHEEKRTSTDAGELSI